MKEGELVDSSPDPGVITSDTHGGETSEQNRGAFTEVKSLE